MNDELTCQFYSRCGLRDKESCRKPELYNGTDSECPVYFDKVAGLIHNDRESLLIDKICEIY